MSKYQRAVRSFSKSPKPFSAEQRIVGAQELKARVRTHKRAHPASTSPVDTHNKECTHILAQKQRLTDTRTHMGSFTDVYKTEGCDTDVQ